MAVHVVRPDEPLVGDVDVERDASDMPPGWVVKGMFFKRLVELIGAGWTDVERTLREPPNRGRYVAFKNYPQGDYTRVAAAAARRRFPELGQREANRRLAREDFDVFADSTFGRVILAMVGDARSALLKTPLAYTTVAPGDWKITARELDGRTVRIEFAPHHGGWDALVGQIEGVLAHFDATAVVTVDKAESRYLRLDVEYSDGASAKG